jgi:hypothetical protein
MSENEPRVFARWRREADPGPGYWSIPADGGCLSVFLLVADPTDPARIALGTPDPQAPWSRIGALDADRLARIGDRLMLPSSHLVEYESPDAAARRIAYEQLGRTDLVLTGPHVISDSYARPGSEDPRSLARERYARSHDDIVRFSGFETPR